LAAAGVALVRWIPTIAVLVTVAALAQPQESFRPDIHRVWDEKAMEDMEIPLPAPGSRPRHVTASCAGERPKVSETDVGAPSERDGTIGRASM
jgi:hypothetical protein